MFLHLLAFRRAKDKKREYLGGWVHRTYVRVSRGLLTVNWPKRLTLRTKLKYVSSIEFYWFWVYTFSNPQFPCLLGQVCRPELL